MRKHSFLTWWPKTQEMKRAEAGQKWVTEPVREVNEAPWLSHSSQLSDGHGCLAKSPQMLPRQCWQRVNSN